MATFLVVILLFALALYVFPRLVLWYIRYKVEKRTRQIYEQARRQQQQRDDYHGHNGGWPRPPRKKIDPDVGEYVDFVDVNTYTSSSTVIAESAEQTVKYEVEEQVVDVEWEDIK